MLGGEFFLFLGILLVSLSRIIGDCPYAKFSPEHTACLPPNPTCNIIRRGVTDQDKEHIVKLHNQYRSKIATGQETRGGGMPQAANMMELVWDDELAKLAQLHAEQCEVEHECNECRQVDRFPVGQNLFYSGDNILPTHFDWDSIMEVFYDEVSYFNSGDIKPYVFDEPYAHFTQLVWGPSQYVGCGSIIANASGFFNTIYVCDFGIAGNDIGGEMYRVGSTCSACPANASSCTISGQDSYEGLCTASSVLGSLYIPVPDQTTGEAATSANNDESDQQNNALPAEVEYETPVPATSGETAPVNNDESDQQNNVLPAEVEYETPVPATSGVTAPVNNDESDQQNNVVPAEVVYEVHDELNYESPAPENNDEPDQQNNIVATEVEHETPVPVTSGAPTPVNNKPDQQDNIVPAEIVHEAPGELNYESPAPANNDEPNQQNNIVPAEVVYEAPGQLNNEAQGQVEYDIYE